MNADVFCIVEAEDRTGLKRFNETALPKVGGELYEHVMLIDGNDDRGIDVAIMCRKGFEIVRVVSHVDDTDDEGLIFSRDCAEYEIMTPDGGSLLVMVNHFKSKIGGGGDKRLRQAKRVRDVYVKRLEEGNQFIAIAGDLNEAPDQPSMDPLIRKGSTLTDIMVHESFVGDGRPGTHGNRHKGRQTRLYSDVAQTLRQGDRRRNRAKGRLWRRQRRSVPAPGRDREGDGRGVRLTRCYSSSSSCSWLLIIWLLQQAPMGSV